MVFRAARIFCGYGPAFLLALLLAFRPGPVRADHVVLGMSAAFTGPSRSLGIEFYRGAMAYFSWANRTRGGIFGHPWSILARDDAYAPDPAVRNTIGFIKEDDVLLLFGYVGTPTTTRVLPLLKSFADRHAFLFFPFTGAQPTREEPYLPFVFNLRDSYRSETRTIVDTCVALGRTRIAILYQADAFGRSGWDGVRRALAGHGLKLAAEATYRRGMAFNESAAAQVAVITEAAPDAVVAVASYEASAAFIRDLRDAGSDTPVFNLSFVGGEALLALLQRLSTASGKDYARNLLATQVVPSYEDLSLPAVREYRAVMDQYAPPPPRDLVGEGYAPLRYSFVSFEGFLGAKALDALFQGFGRVPRRSELAEAARQAHDLDLGLGVPVAFGPTSGQGLQTVYLTTARGGVFAPADPDDLERLRR